jgi:hypothetical protein
MTARAFYDTVIFELSLNHRDVDHAPCRALLDVDGGAVAWCIVISAVTRGEATLSEYLDELERRCAMQGVEWLEVRSEDISATVRQRRPLKVRLEQTGMQSRDIKQVFAAAWAVVEVFVTRDRDFFDPKDKSRRGKKARGSSVRDLLRDELSIEPLFPAEALRHLGAG